MLTGVKPGDSFQ